MDSKKIYYVYVFLDSRKPGEYKYGKYKFEYEPFYVGKGSGKRIFKHLQDKAKSNLHKYRKIKKIIKETGKEPIYLKIKENLAEKNAFELEARIIKKIGRFDLKTGPLTNLIDGGCGGSGSANVTPKSRKKMGDFTRGKTFEEIYGKEKAKEIKLKIAEANKKREFSEEQRNKVSDKWALTWKVTNPEGQTFIIKSLTKFCKENNLTLTLMHHVSIGLQTHHKGWKCKKE